MNSNRILWLPREEICAVLKEMTRHSMFTPLFSRTGFFLEIRKFHSLLTFICFQSCAKLLNKQPTLISWDIMIAEIIIMQVDCILHSLVYTYSYTE